MYPIDKIWFGKVTKKNTIFLVIEEVTLKGYSEILRSKVYFSAHIWIFFIFRKNSFVLTSLQQDFCRNSPVLTKKVDLCIFVWIWCPGINGAVWFMLSCITRQCTKPTGILIISFLSEYFVDGCHRNRVFESSWNLWIFLEFYSNQSLVHSDWPAPKKYPLLLLLQYQKNFNKYG